MFSGQNVWVLKPNDCNRGKGVHIFNKLEDLRKLISESVNDVSNFLTNQQAT